MDVDSVVLVRADFFRAEERSTVTSKLDTLYNHRKQLRDQTIEFGDRDVTVSAKMYSGHSQESDTEIFEDTVAFLVESSNIERVCQVLTVAWLNDGAAQSIRDEPAVQSRAIRANWRTELNGLTSNYPESLLTSTGPYPGFLVVQSNNEIMPSDTDMKTFRNKLADLDGYGFEPFETLTTVDEAYLIAQAWKPKRDGFLALLSQATTSEGPSTSNEWESWFHFEFRRLKMLTTPLLIDHWLRNRKDSIEMIDSQSYGFTIPEMDKTNKPSDVRETESEVESLRDHWIKTFTETSDEVAEMKDLLAIYRGESRTTRFEQIFPESGEGHLSVWVEALDDRVVDLENSLRRVQTKLEMIAGIVRDRLQSTATRSNLNLQFSVERLTWLLLALGVLQFIISIRETQIIEYVSNLIRAALQVTSIISLITLLAGFLFVGYVIGKYPS